jgi:hypothetical protein
VELTRPTMRGLLHDLSIFQAMTLVNFDNNSSTVVLDYLRLQILHNSVSFSELFVARILIQSDWVLISHDGLVWIDQRVFQSD